MNRISTLRIFGALVFIASCIVGVLSQADFQGGFWQWGGRLDWLNYLPRGAMAGAWIALLAASAAVIAVADEEEGVATQGC